MTKTSSQIHKQKATEEGVIPIAVVTVSDSRSEGTDLNGAYLKEQIQCCGHACVGYELVRDDERQVENALERLTQSQARIILFNGGTGISARDCTYDYLSKKFEKELPGFGEIFRMLSYEQVGAAAMLSRACAGVYKGKVIISMPGSPQAVRLAWEKLIEPELQHLAWEITR